jgi:flavin reductase (DIM6/NTAB) family NADH-FMN oxidoreductase RutF
MEYSHYLSQSVIDSGVAVLSSQVGSHTNLMTVSFYAETSHIPLLVRVSVAENSYTHELISKSQQFGISVLIQKQIKFALYCGTHSGKSVNKVKQTHCSIWKSKTGIILLKNALASSACQVIDALDIDRHTIFIGEIKESYRQSKYSSFRPLLVSDLIKYLDHSKGKPE